MNPSPAELWLREQSERFNGRLPDRPLPVTWLSDPRRLPRSPCNRVARPGFAAFPLWFDVRQTSQGQELASALGPNSGYFQEYAAWSPWASWGFDLTASFVDDALHLGAVLCFFLFRPLFCLFLGFRVIWGSWVFSATPWGVSRGLGTKPTASDVTCSCLNVCLADRASAVRITRDRSRFPRGCREWAPGEHILLGVLGAFWASIPTTRGG